jgi:protocatechuate 3,4-dioxygenase alpha subunit
MSDSFPATPGQTVGPFFHYALPYDRDRLLVPPGTPGAIQLHGVVLDGAGTAVPDALLEIWQADAQGQVARRAGSLRRDGWTFTGFGRCATDAAGRYSFTTVAPGPVEGGLPFFAVAVFARGLTHRLMTRAYLPAAEGVTDVVLTAAGARAATLVCDRDDDGLRFDVRLQGADETVFLATGGD